MLAVPAPDRRQYLIKILYSELFIRVLGFAFDCETGQHHRHALVCHSKWCSILFSSADLTRILHHGDMDQETLLSALEQHNTSARAVLQTQPDSSLPSQLHPQTASSCVQAGWQSLHLRINFSLPWVVSTCSSPITNSQAHKNLCKFQK